MTKNVEHLRAILQEAWTILGENPGMSFAEALDQVMAKLFAEAAEAIDEEHAQPRRTRSS